MGQSLTLNEAKYMISAVKEYHSKLKKAGVNVSEIHKIQPVVDYSIPGQNYFVASLEQFINRQNCGDLISTLPRNKALEVFRKLTTEVYKAARVPSKKNINKTGLPIDSKPKNYVLGSDKKVYFIDFYTPKLLDQTRNLYPFIERLHKTRTQGELQTRFEDKRAIFQVLLAHAIVARPQLRREFEQSLLDFLKAKKETKVVNYLSKIIPRDYKPSTLIKDEYIERITAFSK